MALPVYASLAQLKDYAMQAGRGDETRLEEYLPAASRLVDKLCGVADGFFGLASESVSIRKFRGNATRRLRVTPYRATSIQYVEYAKLDCFAPDFDELIDEKGLYWLVAEGCAIWHNEIIEITAAWGWEEVPDEIVQVTCEMAMLLFRQRDPAVTKIQMDVNGTLLKPEDITPRTRKICAEYKLRRPVVLL